MRALRISDYQGVPAPLRRLEFARARALERERHWPAVRVVRVEFEAEKPSIPIGHQRVRAIVHLGRLVPADVHVRVMSARALADDAGNGAQVTRLWSALSYGNGTYVFEGHMPATSLDDPERLEVLVERAWSTDSPRDR